MATDRTRIGVRAQRSRDEQFTNLYHHIYDVDNLRASYDELGWRKATGVDGVNKAAYGVNLMDNLQDLSQRLKDLSYRPAMKRRSYIPKAGSAKGRPLGISVLEDKIVEQATKDALEPLYETMFTASSYGYRPGRGPLDCLDDLGRTIQQERINYVVEADIRRFFDEVNHDWLLKFLGHRIADKRVLRLISRMLKSGILEDGLVQPTLEGTPQGSILSPLLSNIYLHYCLDLWFKHSIAKHFRGVAYYFRYADDFVACFQYGEDAGRFRHDLGPRLNKFGLRLAEEKTRSLKFGRFARTDAQKLGKKPEEFVFLGYTHYCGKTLKGYFKVKRRTNRERLGRYLRNYTDWVRRARVKATKGEIIRSTWRRLTGYLNYYAITDNLERCGFVVHRINRILFKWINRKSQRPSYTWQGFNTVLQLHNWPKVYIRHDLSPFRREQTC